MDERIKQIFGALPTGGAPGGGGAAGCGGHGAGPGGHLPAGALAANIYPLDPLERSCIRHDVLKNL